MLTAKRIQDVEEVLKRLEAAESGLRSLMADEQSDDSTAGKNRYSKLHSTANKIGDLTRDVANLYS